MTEEQLAKALKALRTGQKRWSYPVMGPEAEAKWLVEWMGVHDRLTWVYSGACPSCGHIIEAELPALAVDEGRR
jgi:hypothetical protein